MSIDVFSYQEFPRFIPLFPAWGMNTALLGKVSQSPYTVNQGEIAIALQ
jgi:hypothetical protein